MANVLYPDFKREVVGGDQEQLRSNLQRRLNEHITWFREYRDNPKKYGHSTMGDKPFTSYDDEALQRTKESIVAEFERLYKFFGVVPEGSIYRAKVWKRWKENVTTFSRKSQAQIRLKTDLPNYFHEGRADCLVMIITPTGSVELSKLPEISMGDTKIYFGSELSPVSPEQVVAEVEIFKNGITYNRKNEDRFMLREGSGSRSISYAEVKDRSKEILGFSL